MGLLRWLPVGFRARARARTLFPMLLVCVLVRLRFEYLYDPLRIGFDFSSRSSISSIIRADPLRELSTRYCTRVRRTAVRHMLNVKLVPFRGVYRKLVHAERTDKKGEGRGGNLDYVRG